jgi:hypothetical protein
MPEEKREAITLNFTRSVDNHAVPQMVERANQTSRASGLTA